MSASHRCTAQLLGLAFWASLSTTAAAIADTAAADATSPTASTAPTVEVIPGPAPDSTNEEPQALHLALLLTELEQLAAQAYEAATLATRSEDLAALRRHVDAVYASVWGQPSGLLERTGAAVVPGWKTRWQTTYTEFDPAYAARYGGAPPAITDPRALGIAGRGRAIRRALVERLEVAQPAAVAGLQSVVASLNNVIGWTRLDDGVTKAERQPRIDLTYRWDAPKSFFQGSADTGWLYEVQAQALNILKTPYGSDIAVARRHAGSLSTLLAKVRFGAEATESARIPEADGGIRAVLQHAQAAGLL